MSFIAISWAVAGMGIASNWTMIVGGDIMTNGISGSRNPFRSIAKTVSAADIAYANLEIPLTTATTRTSRKSAAEIARRDQYVLKGDPKHAGHIRAAGFDMVSLANNHAMDYREKGLTEMIRLLRLNGIRHAGAGTTLSDALRPAVMNVKGIRVGMISFLAFKNSTSNWKCTPATPSGVGISALNFGGVVGEQARKLIRNYVRTAKQNCDLLYVALHWGIEKAYVPSSYQVQLGRAFIEAGADGVLGAHPHVLQGAEVFASKPILYSSGNLVSSRPGATALYRLHYSGKQLQRIEAIPCRIAGGSVALLSGAQRLQGLNRIAGLDRSLKKAFPQARR